MSKHKHSDGGREEKSSASSAHVDSGNIPLDGLPERKFSGAALPEYRVRLSQEALDGIRDHALSDTSVELCGVLAGNLCKDAEGPYLLIEKIIPGAATRRSGAQVTFTHETWDRVHKEMEQRHPDLKIVGWYHTHPGFGIFLSEMDQFIQDNFFSQPHNVALVYDPIANEMGMFVWRGGKSVRLRRYWVGDDLRYDLAQDTRPAPAAVSAPQEKIAPPRHAPESQEFAPAPEDQRPPDKLDSLFPYALVGLLVAIALLAAFWLGGKLARGYDDMKRDQDANDRVASVFLAAIARSELPADMLDVAVRLQSLHTRLQQAQSDMAAGSGKADSEKTLAQLMGDVKDAEYRVEDMRKKYAGAGALANRMKEVLTLMDTLELQEKRNSEIRGFMASIMVAQASQALADPVKITPEERRDQAMMFRGLALKICPEAAREIDAALPGLAPRKEPAAPPTTAPAPRNK